MRRRRTPSPTDTTTALNGVSPANPPVTIRRFEGGRVPRADGHALPARLGAWQVPCLIL
ncbi:hypothetical protein OVA30_17290 [Methylorubrum sp. SL192]|nr:hypothetical protein [Methylorubrum sp. SL192]